ncbi:MAG TPA: HepT-like ribonuclease domain-containing protein [Egicoccus sp.]|nr:HepT-like ribonuclease domain-containing protein [Egicoccus sp.]HSK22156.1 HepT-like ribonuclease domain-containing protein [Egicoccus sp.]
MTPRRLDVDVIRNKLDAIEQSCGVLASLGTIDSSRLSADPVLAAAVERLLGRLVDLAVDVNSHVASVRLGRAPGEYRESFDLAVAAGVIDGELAEQLKPSVGMRNVIVHEYVSLDLDLVAAAVPLAVDGYRRFVTTVARHLIDAP